MKNKNRLILLESFLLLVMFSSVTSEAVSISSIESNEAKQEIVEESPCVQVTDSEISSNELLKENEESFSEEFLLDDPSIDTFKDLTDISGIPTFMNSDGLEKGPDNYVLWNFEPSLGGEGMSKIIPRDAYEFQIDSTKYPETITTNANSGKGFRWQAKTGGFDFGFEEPLRGGTTYRAFADRIKYEHLKNVALHVYIDGKKVAESPIKNDFDSGKNSVIFKTPMSMYDTVNAEFRIVNSSTAMGWGGVLETKGDWGFTMLSEVTSQADLSVNGHEFKTDAEAIKNDQVVLRNTLNIENDYIEGRQPQVSISLPNELKYEENSLTIDGKKVAAKDITKTANKLTVTLNDYLVLKKDMIIELTTTLQDNTHEKVLSMNFDYYEEGTFLLKSNVITLTTHGVKNITVFYKDADGKDIASPKNVTGKLGETYQEKQLSISGYIFTKDSGNAEGTFTEETKDIYFYYRLRELYFKEVPKRLAFGREKIRSQPLIKFGRPIERLIVVDERETNNWRVQLKQARPLTNESIVMPDVFSWVSPTGVSQITNEAITVIESDKKGETDLTELLDEAKQQGIQVNIPVEYQRAGTFKGSLAWALEDVPSN